MFFGLFVRWSGAPFSVCLWNQSRQKVPHPGQEDHVGRYCRPYTPTYRTYLTCTVPSVQGISSFDPSHLKTVKTVEPLTGSELAAQEIVRKEIISFDR